MKRFLLAALVLGGCDNDVFAGADAATDGATETGTDGGGSVDGQGGCSSAMTCAVNAFCTGFDDGTTGPFSDNSAGGGSTQLSPNQRVTCPDSLFARLAQVTVPGNAGAVIVKNITITSSTNAHARIDVYAWLPATTTGAATFIALRPNGDPTAAVAIEAHTDGKWYLNVRASVSQTEIRPLLGAWNHFSLDVVFSAAAGSASITYLDDGAHPQATSLTAATLHTTASAVTDVTAQVGIEPFATTTGEMTVYFDDLAFTPN